MADADIQSEKATKPRAKGMFLLGGLLAILLAAGGFAASYLGLILSHSVDEKPPAVLPLPDIAFIPVPPVVIPLGTAGQNKHLRMGAHLEVATPHSTEVEKLMPRILDVLNGYLRAVEVAQLEDPATLIRLRSQMLRRIQVVTGEGRVRDLLITEFILN